MELNEAAIVSSLEKLGVKASIQEANNQVLVTMSINGYDYPMFIRCLQGGHLMQMITFIPCSLDDEVENEVGKLCHMINKELDMPGFCCDIDSKTVFYRLVIPCLNQKVDEELFHAYFNTTKQVCTMFGTIIHAVAVKAMSLQEMLDKAKELSTANK
jgi:hypothetical protein